MPIDQEFIDLLRSPDSRKPLRLAKPGELEQVNALISGGSARNRAGDSVSETLEQGLVPEGEQVMYPIRDDIPILLTTEAIPFGAKRSDGGAN